MSSKRSIVYSRTGKKNEDLIDIHERGKEMMTLIDSFHSLRSIISKFYLRLFKLNSAV